MVQTHYTEPSSDEDVIMGSFLAMSINEDANTANRKDCTKCPNKGGGNKSLINVTIPNPKPSSDIRTTFKKKCIRENKLIQKQKAMYPVTLLNQTSLSLTKIISYCTFFVICILFV